MLKSKLMNCAKELGHFFGLEIKRTKSVDFNYKWLQNLNIRTIIDIGASVGEFSKSIHKLLPEAKIYAFEPLKDSYLKLVSNTKYLPRFQAFNCGLGERDDSGVDMYHCEYSPSSSLLNMTDLHKGICPQAKNVTIKNVSMRCLDGIVQGLDIEENLFIKIDVQGYEDRVIMGGKKTFSRARIVIAETSFEKLYENQAFFDDIYNIMKGMCFSFKGSWGPMMKNLNDGSVFCCDSVFIKDTK